MNAKLIYNIGIVNYLNTLPYAWALEELQEEENIQFNIEKNTPSSIAQGFLQKKYDFSLLPLGVLPSNDDTIYQSPFGIWSDGAVSSVCLLSYQHIESINTIFLDPESKTSNILIEILVKLFLNKDVNCILKSKYNINQLRPNEAIISIGDKALRDKSVFPLVYDLGTLWKTYTGLPFVFARWISKDNQHPHIVKRIEEKFQNVISRLDDNIYKRQNLSATEKEYLLRIIRYELSPQALRGAEQFIEWRNKLKQ